MDGWNIEDFRAVNIILCDTWHTSYIMVIHVQIKLGARMKPQVGMLFQQYSIQCTTARENTHINHGRWVVMRCQDGFLDCSKHITLVGAFGS